MGGNVYVGLSDTGIVSVPATGGTIATVAPLVGAPAAFFLVPFVTDQKNFYWSEVALTVGSTGGPLAKIPVIGGPTTVLTTTAGYAAGLAVGGGKVYWVDQNNGTVNSIPFGGGSVTVVASRLVTPGGLALQGSTLYLSDANGDLLSVPASGGAVTTLFTGPGLPPNTEVAMYTPPIVTDGTNVYFSVGYVTPGIYRFPLDRSAPATSLASVAASGLAVDGAELYWTDDSSVSSVPIAGGPTRVVWSLDTSIAGGISSGPAVDDTSVYWGVARQTATCGLCPPVPQGQIDAIMKAPK
jgi:hypothetical protein